MGKLEFVRLPTSRRARSKDVKQIVHEVTWYGVASLFALAVDTSFLWILVHFFAVGYLLAAMISFICGATVAYALSVKLAFKFHRLHNTSLEFVSFVAIGLPGMAINAGVISLAVEYFGLHFLAAKLLSASVTFGYNFLARRQLLFLQERSR